MDKKTALLDSYGSVFRGLINAKIGPSSSSIRKTLKLSKDADWAFLCTSMDIIGDACGAIDNFLSFGLNGPTKYNDVGERYLRLYGILSATYIQQEAILKLYQLMNVPPTLKKGKDMLDSLVIRSLRHKLCSHSTNYCDAKSKSMQTYIPVRVDLSGFNCTYMDNNEIKAHIIDLQKAINEHLDMMIELMDRIVEKGSRTLYKGQESSKGYSEVSEKLKDLRIVRKGGFVSRLPDGTKFIITMTS